MQRGRGGKVRVAVLFGGQSGEHDVSLRSAETVMRGLDPERYLDRADKDDPESTRKITPNLDAV